MKPRKTITSLKEWRTRTPPPQKKKEREKTLRRRRFDRRFTDDEATPAIATENRETENGAVH